MTIKKRLFLSNLMMIVVPVVIATVVGLGCMGLVLSVVKSGTNFGLDSDSEFYWASQGAVELAEHYINDNSPQKKATLEDVLNTGVMAIEIQENGNSIYTYGKTMADDKNIIKSAQLLNSDGIVVTSQGRGVFRKTETYNGRNYDIYVMGTQHITTSKSLKMIGVFSLLAIILSVIIAILITNRILTKYVFKKVENPLNLLVYGVNEIGKGNLDYSVTYTENDDEALTLTIHLQDPVTLVEIDLLYTIFAQNGIIARSAKIYNQGKDDVHLTTAMSLCLDLPDCDYEWLQFSGTWSRERHLKVRKLEQGITAINSTRGHSSHEHNPFIILKRPTTDENKGEAILTNFQPGRADFTFKVN